MHTPQSVLSTSMRGEDTSRCPPEGWHVIGLMSGTSVDGLDMASVRITRDAQSNAWNCEMKAFSTEAYPESLRARLWDAMQLDAESLFKLHTDWAKWTSQSVNLWLQDCRLGRPDLIGSHGHTVFHRPEGGWTLQIGCGATLHAELNIPVVCDFRQLDVASGGQGAPLVPLADRELFGKWDVALNLGGFANLSMEDAIKGRVAWDVGPANLLLNLLVGTRGLAMDMNGELASKGTIIPELLNRWKGLSFHQKSAPKSLGREWLEEEVLPMALRALERHSLEDVLATAVSYAGWAIVRDVPNGVSVLVTGGGAFNPTLMDELHRQSAGRNIEWHVPHDDLVHGKEAMVFAWLALLRWLDEPNVLTSVTGSRRATSGGALWGASPSS